MKPLLRAFFVFFTLLASGQTIDRTLVQGEIVVPKGEDRDQISVYNVSSQKGTVTDEEGSFSIEVAANDRVLISALQFQSFTVIIDEGVISKKMMRIYMNPTINQLDDIVVSPYDLSGNIDVDVKRINVYESPNWDLTYETLEFDYEFTQDRLSKIDGNAAEEALNNGGLTNGFNFASFIGLLGKAIVPKKRRKESQSQSRPLNNTLIVALQQRYSPNYYHETFGIPLDRVDDFIYFVHDRAITANMLRLENEMELLAVLFEQSKVYKQRINDE